MWNPRSVVRGSWLMATVFAVGVAAAIVSVRQGARREAKRIDAHLTLADSYYQSHDLANAEIAYRELIKSPRSSAYWYAMYKLGLIDFDLKRFREAAEKFSEVAQGTKDDQGLQSLHRSSTNDYVRAYAEIGEAEQAYPAFQRVDQERTLDMLETLANLYTSQSKRDKAICVYQELVMAAPDHDHACVWQYNVVHAQLSMAGTSKAETVGQIEKFARLSSALHGKNLLPAAEAKACHDNAEAMSGELARAYHSEAARTKSAGTLGYAERLYVAYLEAFPDAEGFAQNQYWYAEVLWTRAQAETSPQLQSKQWQNAANAFSEVVKTHKIRGKLMRESAYAAVLGWKNEINSEPDGELQPGMPAGGDKAPIPNSTQMLLAAIDAFSGRAASSRALTAFGRCGARNAASSSSESST